MHTVGWFLCEFKRQACIWRHFTGVGSSINRGVPRFCSGSLWEQARISDGRRCSSSAHRSSSQSLSMSTPDHSKTPTREDVHKSCKSLEAIVNLLNVYCEAASAIVLLQKKLIKAIRDAVSTKASPAVAGEPSLLWALCTISFKSWQTAPLLLWRPSSK